MNRDRVVVLAVAVLGVLALATGAAVIDSPTKTAGTGGGSGGRSGGFLGHGSAFGFGQRAWDAPTLGDFPRVYFEVLIAALLVAFLVALYLQRDQITLRNLRNAAATAVIMGFLFAVVYFLLQGLSLGSGGGGGTGIGKSPPAAPGGGTGGSADSAVQPVATNLPIIALAVGVVLVVGLAAVFWPEGEENSTESDPDPANSRTMTGVGRAAGRAADRIEGDAGLENEVYRAWREMTTHLDVANPASSTPGEFARAATDAGMNRRDVDELTELFTTVRYGERRVTSDRESRAVAALRRIEAAYTEEA